MNIKFSTAVLKAANELASSQPSFSLYEVTKRLRDHVNQDVIGFSDRTPEDVNGTTTYRVEHNDVRAEFNELYEAKALLLDKKTNGRYFEYALQNQPQASVSTVAAPSNASGKVVTVNPPAFSVALTKYISGFANGTLITMKQIQSRFDNQKGITCADYANLLNGMGYIVDTSDQYPSKWNVEAGIKV